MVIISVAHSSVARGAHNKKINISEYDVSKKASLSCFQYLQDNEVPCVLFDVGPWSADSYLIRKPQLVNAVAETSFSVFEGHDDAELVVEIHCNGSDEESAKYNEVLYVSESGKKAAESVCRSIANGFLSSGRHVNWPSRGAVKSVVGLAMLYKTKCPAIIAEGVFITNNEQAEWLKNGGSEAYGMLVAEGILNWKKNKLS